MCIKLNLWYFSTKLEPMYDLENLWEKDIFISMVLGNSLKRILGNTQWWGQFSSQYIVTGFFENASRKHHNQAIYKASYSYDRGHYVADVYHPFLTGESQGQRSLVGYSPCGHKESDMTEWLSMSMINLILDNTVFWAQNSRQDDKYCQLISISFFLVTD